MTTAAPVVERIMAKVEHVGECWQFTGSRSATGYARIHYGARNEVRLAHRVMYELRVGAVPAGLDLDHLCRNRACVNPAHLEPVTRSENLRRGIGGELAAARNKAKTHCPEGHAYDAANTRLSRKGGRGCKRCEGADYRALRAARKRLAASS